MTTTTVNYADETGGDDLFVDIVSEKDEHDGHDWEASESFRDNAVEYTHWGYCRACSKEFKIASHSLSAKNRW